ncbi:MAG: GNAT family N-acetyltransferase [Thermoanaerobaculia bacterium]
MSFSVRAAIPGDSGGIRELFGTVFPRVLSEAEWRWKYPENPDGWLSVVAERNGKIVGHYGGCLMAARIGGSERTIVSLGDVATDPSVRHLGGRRSVFRCMAELMFDLLRERGIPFGFGFPSARAFEVGRRLLGYRSHFPIRETRLDCASPESRDDTAGVSDSVGPGFDRLWEKARPWLGRSCLVRDAVRANWRYQERPDRSYRMLTIPGEDGDRAWGVISVFGETALVMDYLLESPDPVLAERLARALAREGLAMGGRELAVWEAPGGRAWAVLDSALGRLNARRWTQEAGFSFVTAVVFEEEALQEFLRDLNLVAGIYDDR